MEKVLFISSFIGQHNSGGAVASLRNLELCRHLFSGYETEAYGFSFKETNVNENVKYLPSYNSPLKTFINYSFGNAGGLAYSNIYTIRKLIRSNNYRFVFLDGSLLGKLAKYIKQKSTDTAVIVFFHNIEKDFFSQVYGNNPAYLPLQKSAAYNEKLSTRYADYILCFNQRDAGAIEKHYGRKPGAIFPVTVNDRFNKRLAITTLHNIDDTKLQLLFVGSDFPANTNGLIWFVQKVMPGTNAFLTVVGKGMEKYKAELESSNVKIVGTAVNIDEYYYNAGAVVAPVFYGSGMKVKIAEALMMGKTIFGTSEAWQGYDEQSQLTGFVCNTSDEFIQAINTFKQKPVSIVNEPARKVYEQLYSPQSQLELTGMLKEKLFSNHSATV